VTPPRGGLFRHPDFRQLWLAETVSQIGSQITLLALPLAAILTLDAGAFEVAVLAACERVPFLIIGLPAGVWVDRLRRRRIMVVADLWRAGLLASVPVAHAFGALTMPQLYVVALLTGVGTVFFDVAYQSHLPALVPRDRIAEGNAKLEISRSGAQIAGPALAGLLVGVTGAPPAIAIDAASFVGSAGFLFGIRGPDPRPDADAPRTKLRADIVEGLRYVLGHRYLRAIAGCTAISNFGSGIMDAVLILFAIRQLGLSEATVGVVFTLSNVFVPLAAVMATRVIERLGVGRTIVLTALTFGPAALWFPLAPTSTPIPFLVAGLSLIGVAGLIYNVAQVTLRQTITPDRLLGRMNATMRFMVWGTLPLGALTGGVLAGAIGLRNALWVSASISACSVIPVLLSPVPKLRSAADVEVAH
jgi:MFS family permease